MSDKQGKEGEKENGDCLCLSGWNGLAEDVWPEICMIQCKPCKGE